MFGHKKYESQDTENRSSIVTIPVEDLVGRAFRLSVEFIGRSGVTLSYPRETTQRNPVKLVKLSNYHPPIDQRMCLDNGEYLNLADREYGHCVLSLMGLDGSIRGIGLGAVPTSLRTDNYPSLTPKESLAFMYDVSANPIRLGSFEELKLVGIDDPVVETVTQGLTCIAERVPDPQPDSLLLPQDPAVLSIWIKKEYPQLVTGYDSILHSS